MNFWDELTSGGKKIVGLSPMDGVTDAPMRYMTAKYGKPDVMFTEFVSVDALAHVVEPRKVDQVLRAFLKLSDVAYEDSPRRTGNGLYEVAQVFGHTPELFYQAAVLVATLGFDGVDINMGCPAHKVEELGSGAGLIRTPDVAQEIVRQAKRGVADWAKGSVGVEDLDYSDEVKRWASSHSCGMSGDTVKPCQRKTIPVSVKTRIGVDQSQVEEWIPAIMETSPAVLSVHGRTLKQLYQGRADWGMIGRAGEIVHKMGGKILGNGDIKSINNLQLTINKYGVDGVLIGRAAEGNPAIFAGCDVPTREQRMAWIIEHAEIYDKLFVQTSEPAFRERAFVPLRKFLAWYASGFPAASELRQKLVVAKNLLEVTLLVGPAVNNTR